MRFVEGGTLVPVPTLGGLHQFAPNTSLSAHVPASKLEPHGLSIINGNVDIVFLTEIRGEISEVQKLLFDSAGNRFVSQVWPDDSEQCSIMMVARAKQFLFKSLAKQAVRGVVAAVPNGVPMILFGCHAKSGGSHETQADLAAQLQQVTVQWGAADGSLSSVALAIGDFIRWRAWHPGVPLGSCARGL